MMTDTHQPTTSLVGRLKEILTTGPAPDQSQQRREGLDRLFDEAEKNPEWVDKLGDRSGGLQL